MNIPAENEVEVSRRERDVRNGILRSAIIWTPFFIASLGGFLFFLADELTGGDRGSWFLVIILGIFSFLFGSQSIQALADLFGKPREMEGQVTRRWARNDSIVLRTHYVRIDSQILRGEKLILDPIKTGDRVEARYFPHSGVLIWLEKVEAPAVEEPAAAEVTDVEASAAEPEPAEPATPRSRAERPFWD